MKCPQTEIFDIQHNYIIYIVFELYNVDMHNARRSNYCFIYNDFMQATYIIYYSQIAKWIDWNFQCQ